MKYHNDPFKVGTLCAIYSPKSAPETHNDLVLVYRNEGSVCYVIHQKTGEKLMFSKLNLSTVS